MCSALFLFSSPLIGGEIHGRVTGPDGMPIKDVCVEGLTLGCKRTDLDGRFVLPRIPAAPKLRPRAIWFHAEGYQPLAVLIPPGIDVLNASLKPNGSTLWHVPTCDGSDTLATGRNLGVHLMTEVKDSGLVHAPDVTARYVDFEFRRKIFHVGMTFSGLVDEWPGESRYAASRAFSQRTWVSDDALTGFDGRGIFNNGKYWRSIGTYGGRESVEYIGVPKEVAEIFDRVLDTVCVMPRSQFPGAKIQ
jgi:hypothetical protein